jgi:hypothetical protein
LAPVALTTAWYFASSAFIKRAKLFGRGGHRLGHQAGKAGLWLRVS